MLQKPWVRNSLIAGIVLFLLITIFSLKQVVAPVFVALTIAYIGDPVIDWFERHRISRTWGIVILIALFCLLLLGFALYLIPLLIREAASLAEAMPRYWERLNEFIRPQIEGHEEDVAAITEKVLVWAEENAGVLANYLSNVLIASFRSMGSLVSSLLALVIIPVLAFYLLRDFDIMTGRAKLLIPLDKRELIVGLFAELHQALSNFIKGQLLVAIILSIIYSVGLMIAGCPAALLIGVIAGFANLIPYLGIALGFIPAVLITYLSGNPLWQVIVAGMTFVVGQMLEGMVITPKVVGESVGLHPVVVMVGLMIGGTYFGFVGMILALPMTAVAMVLLRRVYYYYTSSRLYNDDSGAGARAVESEGGVSMVEVLEASAPPKPEKKKRARRMRGKKDRESNEEG